MRRPPKFTRSATLFPSTTLFRSLSPFTRCVTHGIFVLPGCRVRYSSAELGWSSLFLSEQDEAPFSAEVNATNDHLIVMHLSDPTRVQLEADTMTACAVIPRQDRKSVV